MHLNECRPMFISFIIGSKYVKTRPAYITLVRDPVEKFISNFRFRRMDPETTRQEMARRERVNPGEGRKWYWKTLEDCIMQEDPECKWPNGQPNFVSSVAFLCGQKEQCL